MLKSVPDHICISMGDEKKGDIVKAEQDYEDLKKIAKKYAGKFRERDHSNSQRFIKNKPDNSFK